MSRSSLRKQSNPKTGLWVGLAAAIVLIAVAVIFLTRPAAELPAVTMAEEISAEEAAQLLDQGAFILDVCEEDEWLETHIPDSTHIALGELSSRLNEVPTDRVVIIVDSANNLSVVAYEILVNAGYTQVTTLSGGVLSWVSAGYATVSGE